MQYALGVDLGTTFTGAALGHPTAGGPVQTEMMSLGDRTVLAPAIVFAPTDAPLLTGDAAARRALENPDAAAREFKRRLGDPTPLLLGGRPYDPTELLAAILSSTVTLATEGYGQPPAAIVLTCPAVWGPYHRTQLAGVAELTRLPGLQLVPEPIAAATFYTAGQPRREGEVIAVYDLGGETFDATVLRVVGGELQVLGDPESIDWLGGVDFDESVLGYIDQALDGAVTSLDLGDPTEAILLTQLQRECLLAKEALSVENEVSVRALLPGAERHVRLTRPDFENLVRPKLAATVEALHRALDSARVKPAELDAVLLVGGSSRIPLVSRLVEEAVGMAPRTNPHPKHAVALGAAAIAAGLLPTLAPDRNQTAVHQPVSFPPARPLIPPHRQTPALIPPARSLDQQTRPPDQPALRPDHPALPPDRQTLRPGQQTLHPDQQTLHPDQQTLHPDQQGPPPESWLHDPVSPKQLLIGLVVAVVLVATGVCAGLFARGQLPWPSS